MDYNVSRSYYIKQRQYLIEEFERWPMFYTKEQMVKLLIDINLAINNSK
jgi:hypothetical protein